MFKINPYRPGTGLMPMYLAGRDEDIYNAEQMLEAMKANIPTQSVIFSGLRGVGKTVLINRLQSKIRKMCRQRQKIYLCYGKMRRTALHNFQYRPKSQQKRYCHINDESTAD